jgi:SSS family solute:Na+ symporter
VNVSIIAVIIFLAANLAFASWRRPGKPPREPLAVTPASGNSEYTLAGRSLSGPALLATLAASNLSAFTVFGVSGASYRLGWAFFPVMAFGTAFMAVSFAVVGVPLRRMSARRGWTTPGDFITDRFGSRWLGWFFSGLSLLYTIPYLAIQAGAGGKLIEDMTGMPRIAASGLLVAIVATYVWRGGMRSVARTDILQLAALIVLAVAAGIIVVVAAGPSGAAARVAADAGRISRAGVGNTLGWLPLLGYYVLWSFADPMFPHFIQRFYAARSDKALLSSMMAYPVVAVLVFLPVCAVGVMGSVMVPGLAGTASDGIFTLLVHALAGPIWGPVFALAALAALMSTMDSQLLSCATMIGADLLPGRFRGKRASQSASVLLAVLGWLVSIKPPVSILDFLNKTAFPGYASLMPVALLGIYAPRLGHWTAAVTLLAGTMLVLAESAGVFHPPVPAALFNAGVQLLVLIAATAIRSLFRKPKAETLAAGSVSLSRLFASPHMVAALLATIMFGVLGMDFWNYGRIPAVVFGLPGWVVYHACLTLALCGAFWLVSRAVPARQA